MKYRLNYLIFFLLFILILSGCSSRENEITVGFLYTGNIQDSAVYTAQDLAREEMVKEMNGAVETIVKESVDASHIESVIYDMVNSGARLIFISDNQLEEQILKAASVYSYVDFVVYNGSSQTSNVKPYYIKNYEADYLAGITAAETTKTNHIGYIAPDNSPQSTTRINAFALGVLKIKPDAVIDLDYVNDSASQSRINAAISKLTFDQCDVIATCSSENKALIEAADRGIKVIGNTSSGLDNKKELVAAIALNYKDFFISEIEAVLNNTFDSTPYTATLADGFVSLDENGTNVSSKVKREVSNAQQEIINGNLIVFSGPISDNAGNVVINQDQILTESDITNMNFLLSNVKVLS